MRISAHAISAVLMSLAATPTSAQPIPLAPALSTAVISVAGSRPTDAHSLALPKVAVDAPPEAFLTAARTAMLAGRTREAYGALERAEARLLSRSTTLDLSGAPVTDQVVLKARMARADLATRDRSGALRAIDDALGTIELALRRPPPAPLTIVPPSSAPGPFVQMVPQPQPMITNALLPGHWQLSGANYVWIPPEARLRRVENRRYVQGRYIWRGGRWEWKPAHYAN